MPVSNDPTIFPCGRGNFPGTLGPGGGGQEPTITPSILVPKPPDDPIPPFIPPIIPPQLPAVKCVEISEGAPSPQTGFRFSNPPYRQCMPCDGLKNTIIDPTTGLTLGPANNPSPGDQGCVYASIEECKPNCENPQERILTPGATVDPPFSTTSPPQPPIPPGRLPTLPPAPGGGGGTSQFHKCEVVAIGVCPGQEGLPLNEATITSVFTECRPCSPNFINANGSVEADPTCSFSSLALCQANCASPTFTNLPCPPEISAQEPDPTGPITPGGSTTEPTLGFSVGDVISTSEPTQNTLGVTTTPLGDPIVLVPVPGSNEPSVAIPGVPQVIQPQSPSISTNVKQQSIQIANNQQAVNGNLITAGEIVEDEDFRNVQKGIAKPILFDPELNFFKSEATEETLFLTNTKNLDVFNSQIAEEVSQLLTDSNFDDTWNELTLQNLSDDKLVLSLNPLLLNSFQYLRYPGGQLIGVSTLLNVVRKHLLEGTIDEFDPSYYIDSAQAQLEDKFDVLQKPETKELADRLAVKFLTNNLNTYLNNKGSTWRNFQINRVRPLNDDVDMELDVELLDGTTNDISIPNDGFEIDRITPSAQITSPIFGSPDKLNIGDGGGYYVRGTDINEGDVPIYTDNILEDSYYAPASVRMKVLDMLNVDSSIKISASSVSGGHEFVSGDSGPTAVAPLFFALNVTSVDGDYTSNSLIEDYSGTYTRVTDSSDIARYVNNHALSLPMLCLDYRDPLYRYILDTSTLTASLKDFNLNGFENKAFSSIGSRFVKNIPFGFIVTPVAGGKYNPFNGGSKLEQTGDIHVRSVSILPVTDLSIDSNQATTLKTFSLNLVSGVDQIGIGEGANTQNIGYQYSEEDFTQTFYSASAGDYGTSSPANSVRGTAYFLREVIDYLSGTYNSTEFTWFDAFSRMPITKVGEMFYDSDEELILKIANGFRGGVTLKSIESGVNASSKLVEEDSKTIVSVEDRRGVTTIKI
jgi:hypothetical protein